MPDSSATEKITPLRKPVPCPQCGKHSTRERYPFCSKRCAELDLGAWFNDRYTVAVEEEDAGIPDR